MSVTITTIRHLRATQVSTYEELELFEYHRCQPYDFIELVSVGWTGGARVRVKRISDFPKLYAYLNKLRVHGYLTDDSYTSAWIHAQCVEDNIRNAASYRLEPTLPAEWSPTQYEFVDPLKVLDC